MRVRSLPGARKCLWPTNSERILGRIRAANGAAEFRLAFSEEANRFLSALSSRIVAIIRWVDANVERISPLICQPRKSRVPLTGELGDMHRLSKL